MSALSDLFGSDSSGNEGGGNGNMSDDSDSSFDPNNCGGPGGEVLYRECVLHDLAEKGDVEALRKALGLPEEADAPAQAADAPAPSRPHGDDDDDLDVDERDFDGLTPLHLALINGKLDCAELLISAGAGTSAKCEGSPLLHTAMSVGAMPGKDEDAERAVSLVLSKAGTRVTVRARDQDRRTAVHNASQLGLVKCIEMVIERVAAQAQAQAQEQEQAPNANDDDDRKPPPTPAEAVSSFINARDDAGDTALHLGARFRNQDVVYFLLSKGADATIANHMGDTPAHDAARVNCAALAMQLLTHAKHGKGQHPTNARGKTPAQVAQDRGYDEAAQYIEAGARNDGNAPNATAGGRGKPTLVLRHPVCLEHYTCPPIVRHAEEPPSENVRRLKVLTDPDYGILRSKEFADRLTWDESPPACAIADVLRVHDYSYVKHLVDFCTNMRADPHDIRHLDPDTSVSRKSMDAALVAAGMVCEAIDKVVDGTHANAFCAARPPGHHAGPSGLVTCANDPHGSMGFCLLNNVAVGAAYARSVHRHKIKKIAIVDFDVHHGNGTEEIIENLTPRVVERTMESPFCSAVMKSTAYKPWLNEQDIHNVYFASVHGFGRKSEGPFHRPEEPWFYPGSGASCGMNRGKKCGVKETKGKSEGPKKEEMDDMFGSDSDDDDDDAGAAADADGDGGEKEGEQDENANAFPLGPGPLIVNVGVPMNKPSRVWRQAWRDTVCAQLMEFSPDLILVSAGFDGHRADLINYGYVGVREADYEWLTRSLVKVANSCCEGRIVSVLEGGYKTQGNLVSAFARSVGAHVRALADPCVEKWSEAEAAQELAEEHAQAEQEQAEREKQARLAREAREQAYLAHVEEVRRAQQAEAEAAAAALAEDDGVGVNVLQPRRKGESSSTGSGKRKTPEEDSGPAVAAEAKTEGDAKRAKN